MKRIKATHILNTLSVIGSGSFPYDMLRYDSCVPDTQTDVTRAFVDRESRIVYLRQYVPADSVAGPTIGRWESFGWKVTA